MFERWLRWRRNRILRRNRIDADRWDTAIRTVHTARHLDPEDRVRLRDLASLFLHEKSIEPAADMEITEAMRVRIAAEACLPILNLGLEDYDDWYTVVLYPDEFIAPHEYRDEAGVVHAGDDARIGESWDRGPVVISWADVQRSAPGMSVVIHEMAHKLDQRDGTFNGHPPLHRDMKGTAWHDAFSTAFDDLTRRVHSDEDTAISSYGAENPAEFFAVVSEEFFCRPRLLYGTWPDVYEQLERYYRQRTLGR